MRTSTPTVGLAVPAAKAGSPWTMVAIIAKGMSALPPVPWAPHRDAGEHHPGEQATGPAA
jgi:hypothetical protein